MLRIILIIIELALFFTMSAFEETQVFEIEGSYYNPHNNPFIRVYPISHINDCEKEMPIYEFEENTQGDFLREFVDSLATMDSLSSIIKIQSISQFKNLNTVPLDNWIILNTSFWNEDAIEECKGVIINSNHRLSLIFDDDPSWIDKLNLKKTPNSLTIKIGKSYLKEKPILWFLDDIEIWAVLEIQSNNKIDPIMIYNRIEPIQDIEKYIKKFDWIELFYKTHNLPEGCGFYRQPSFEQLLRSREHESRQQVVPPSTLLEINFEN